MTLYTPQTVNPAGIKIQMDEQHCFAPAGYGDVVKHLKANPRKTDKEKIELAKEILTRLTHLHLRNIVHERVHAGNVLVGNDKTAELCDAQRYAEISSDEDGRNFIPSKCWWMPPEQLIAARIHEDICPLGPPSKAANVYGVALTIIQLWTLERPFPCMRNEYQLISMLHKLKSGDVTQVQRPLQVPERVWGALQGCLSVDPGVRPTAEVLLKRFEVLTAEGGA